MLNENEKFIVVDTETTNSLDDPICYDVGFAVVDTKGTVYEKYSFVVADIFLDKDLMSYAYFAEKIPTYWKEIKLGKRTLKTFYNIKKIFKECVNRNNVKIIFAHNAKFDYNSLTLTQRYLTSSKYRYFFPYGVEIWDTLKMARQTLNKTEEYKNFCHENNYITKNNQNCFTAEVLYKFLTDNKDFVENHTGLEDALIEKEIFNYCVAKNPEINGRLWKK